MYCSECGRPQAAGHLTCTACGNWLFLTSLSSDVDLGEVAPSVLIGPLASVTVLPESGTLICMGPKGVGKSTVALQSFDRPAVITTEMSPELVVRYARRLGVHIEVAARPEVNTDAEGKPVYSWPHDHGRAGGLVVDSVNGVADPITFWRWAQAEARARQLPLICTAQVTTEGTLKSGTTIPHECDAVVKLAHVAGGVLLDVEKCRFGEVRSGIWRRTGQARRYVVTGGGGQFDLGVWPFMASDVYELYDLGKLELPPPPTAVAARVTRRDGWVDPDDVEARAQFARAAGVQFITAEELNEQHKP